jgi:hypothetical protein
MSGKAARALDGSRDLIVNLAENRPVHSSRTPSPVPSMPPT